MGCVLKFPKCMSEREDFLLRYFLSRGGTIPRTSARRSRTSGTTPVVEKKMMTMVYCAECGEEGGRQSQDM